MEVIQLSRNEMSRFSQNPTNIDISRSKFNRSSSVKFTFNVGDLIPFYVDEVLPGDTFSVDTNKVVRMQTMITPMMDNIYLDTYYFFVPNRLVWQHWREFNGENTQGHWYQTVTYQVPQITAPTSNGWNVGTIADYMGIPPAVPGLSVNALPIRAYCLICNDWFRDENLTDPLFVPLTDATVVGNNTDPTKGGAPYKAAKYHDYFTSCLPAPQKGPDVSLPGASISGEFPVITSNEYLHVSDFPHLQSDGLPYQMAIAGRQTGTLVSPTDYHLLMASGASDRSIDGDRVWGTQFINRNSTSTTSVTDYTYPVNLYAKVDAVGVATTINELRTAFQLQKLYEKDARGGTRYVEIIKSHFGVTSPDARQQRPEYLGGNRLPINVNQVVQQSETSSTPQGTVSAYSLTTDAHSDFTKSFTEHGFVIGICVARYDHTYQQGLSRMFSRKTRFDYYWPVLANIGEMAVKNSEIYATGTSTDDQVFGYQEAWADYRYRPSYVAGEMRSVAAQSLDSWHLADDYASMPYLSDGWIREDKSTVDRVLAVTSSVSNQLFADFYIKNMTTRPMPMYSIPGLIDHH